MPATIVLTVVQGKCRGQQFAFDERTTCLVGRDDECRIRFPKDREHQNISRHHCLLDLNPPDARIRDLGSRAGTYVNDRLIGKRRRHQTAQEGVLLRLTEHDLQDGDRVRIGNVVLEVAVRVPAVCGDCSVEIAEAEQERARLPQGGYRCVGCRQVVATTALETASYSPVAVCLHCGQNLAGEKQSGEFVCSACWNAPEQMVAHLLEKARHGARELIAVQGYRIEKALGRGGTGAVYLAVHEKSGERMALKVMLPQVAADARGRERFLREVAATTLLHHRHVVRLYDLGCSLGMFFFTLEYCEGGSVAKMLKKRGGPLSVEKAIKIIRQVLDGLAYAHNVEVPNVRLADGSIGSARGLVHRDIKPRNLFLARAGRKFHVKIGDYGLAKAFDLAGLSGMSLTGAAAGTPRFMPRQQLIDFQFARPEVDVWAAAATLYHLLTLAYPRDFPKNKDPWQIVLQTDAVPIRRRNAAIPKRLAAVIDKALVERPVIPFQSAEAFRNALENAL